MVALRQSISKLGMSPISMPVTRLPFLVFCDVLDDMGQLTVMVVVIFQS